MARIDDFTKSYLATWMGSLCVVAVVLLGFVAGIYVGEAWERVRNTGTSSPIKKLMLALDNYHHVHGQFPESSGRSHTWRLELFSPELGEVFQGYDSTILWNAPANLKWSKEIGGCPSVFAPRPDDNEVSQLFFTTDLATWTTRQHPVRVRVFSVGDDSVLVGFDPDSTRHWLDPAE